LVGQSRRAAHPVQAAFKGLPADFVPVAILAFPTRPAFCCL